MKNVYSFFLKQKSRLNLIYFLTKFFSEKDKRAVFFVNLTNPLKTFLTNSSCKSMVVIFLTLTRSTSANLFPKFVDIDQLFPKIYVKSVRNRL